VTVNDTITNITNNTTRVQAENRVTGTTDLGPDAFLQLLMTQLKYQDPLNPMSNTEFLSQQAQFTQISELQKLNKSFSGQTLFVQASSLVGKTVSFLNPDNPSQTMEGKVTEAKFNDKGTAVVVDGKDYPLDIILSIKDSQGEV